MKKGLIITLLVMGGLIGLAGLVIGAVLEVVEALVSFVIWSLIILIGYVIVKTRT